MITDIVVKKYMFNAQQFTVQFVQDALCGFKF